MGATSAMRGFNFLRIQPKAPRLHETIPRADLSDHALGLLIPRCLLDPERSLAPDLKKVDFVWLASCSCQAIIIRFVVWIQISFLERLILAGGDRCWIRSHASSVGESQNRFSRFSLAKFLQHFSHSSLSIINFLFLQGFLTLSTVHKSSANSDKLSRFSYPNTKCVSTQPLPLSSLLSLQQLSRSLLAIPQATPLQT